MKEVDAAKERVGLCISTREQESLLHDGRRLRPKLRQLEREEGLMQNLRQSGPNAAAPQPQQGVPGAPKAARVYPSDELPGAA